MRVYDLARQLNIQNKELLDKISSLGIAVKSHSSSIDDKSVRMVLDALEKEGGPRANVDLTPEKPAKKPAPQKKAPAPGPSPEIPKVDARTLALQALERAKAKRAKQHQAALEQQATEAEATPGKVVAPEYQRVELGGSRTPQEAPPVPTPPPAAPTPVPEAKTPAPAPAAPQAPPPPAQKRPPVPTKPAPGPGAPRQQRVIRRNVELQQLPSLPKRKPPPAARPKTPDLTLPPVMEAMKMRPARRPAAKKAGEKEADKRRKRGGGQVPAGGKKIRPGRFLNIANIEDTVTGQGRRRSGGRRPMASQKQKGPVVHEPVVYKIHSDLTLGEFAEKIQVPATEVIAQAMALGEMLTLNRLISLDLCELLAAELDVQIEVVVENDDLDVAEFIEEPVDVEAAPRPPVVTVMGHVDHGKTTLLDTIRKTSVADGEFGGITQHIGAYRVATERGEIVFLDTPGHAAFTAMRARGASVTDIVILIVAADDGLMPQTIEAINHSRAADVPIIVAINKIDLPGANLQKVKNELMQHSLIGEDLGGDTIICEVSAKEGLGIDALLEMVQLQAEMMELKAPADCRAEGVVIESHVDPQRGINATILIKSGTLRAGDAFVSGDVSGRVRRMLDDSGKDVEQALPAHPVEILGLDGCPQVGETFMVLESEKQARQVAQIREIRRRRQNQNAALRPHVTLEGLADYLSQDDKPKDLNIILKADVQGSVEAVSDAMEQLSGEKVSIKIIHSGVGTITESDVQLAMASDAVVVGFNIRPDAAASDLASQEGIDVRTYRVIYELLEELASAMLGMLDAAYREETRGKVEIRQLFKVSRLGNIAGCYVTDGSIQRNDKVRLIRDGVVMYEGRLSSLRRVKDDAREVSAGYECGIVLQDYQDIKPGDIIEAYYDVEVEQTL